MINYDILEALELVKQEFTNSLVKKEMPKEIFKNKKVLFLSNNFNILMHVFSNKPLCVFYNDEFLKYYIDLKLYFIKYSTYEKYVSYFNDKINLFNYDNYYEISKYLSEKVRLFWDALYENVNYYGYKIRKSKLFSTKYIDDNDEISRKQFENIKKNIDLINVCLYSDNIEKIDYIIVNDSMEIEFLKNAKKITV